MSMHKKHARKVGKIKKRQRARNTRTKKEKSPLARKKVRKAIQRKRAR